jgi:hypothetical protein
MIETTSKIITIDKQSDDYNHADQLNLNNDECDGK